VAEDLINAVQYWRLP